MSELKRRRSRTAYSLVLALASLAFSARELPKALAEEGESLLARARAAYAKRHIAAESKRAVDLYEKLIKSQPSYEALWEGARATSHLGQNAWAKASGEKRQTLYKKGLEWAEQAVVKSPSGAEGHFYVAVLTGLYVQERTFLHQMTSARDIRLAAERALKIDPGVECGGPPRLLGLYYRHLPEAFGGDNEKARRYMEQAIRHCPDDASLHYALAECLHRLGKNQRARQEAQWVLDHPPTSPADRREYGETKRATEELLEELD